MIRKMVNKVLPYKPIKVSRKLWDERYSHGKWDRISGIDELARYSLIAGYIYFLKMGASILDVGCGEGILCERLCKNSYSRYMGIDISSVAIEKALINESNKDHFAVKEIMEFRTDDRFDVIVFNECLYYVEEPIETLKYYERLIKKDGLFIVSMHDNNQSNKIWKPIAKNYFMKDSVFIRNVEGICWTVKIFGVC